MGGLVSDEADTPKPAVPPEDNPRKRQEFFVQAPLRAAARLQKQLPIDELGYRRVIGYGHADARAYFVYGALDEALKASMAGLRWLELLADEPESPADPEKEKAEASAKPDRDGDEHIGRLLLESVIDEQEMWARKLTEILFDLVLFSTTNDQEFYRLYLACKQLDAYLGLQSDFEEFFACRSANADATIRRLLKEIEQVRERIEVGRAWFVADGVDLRRPRGRIFRSARQRFIRAQTVAPPDLQLVMGPSYEMGYSAPSRSVHPNVGGPTREFTKAQVERNLDKVGLLGLHIVALAHEVAEIEPAGESRQLVNALRASDGPAMFRRVFQRELEVGDVVFAYSEDLCQIVETAKSKYGNTSYKVRYLTRPMLDGIEEDWFPARYIRLLYRRRDIKPAMIDGLRRAGSAEDQVRQFEGLSETEAARVLARTFTDLEEKGVLRMMLKPRRRRGGRVGGLPENSPTALDALQPRHQYGGVERLVLLVRGRWNGSRPVSPS
jgi:hypothetical protein